MTALAAEAEAEPKAAEASQLTRIAVLIAIGVLCTTLAQPGALLSSIPIRNMIKNEMHLPRSATSGFIFLIGLPWYFKPLAGILTDAFPVLGSRRKTYLLASSGLATLAWVAMFFTPHRYAPMLIVALVLSLFMMMASTVVGAFMVEAGHATGVAGRLSSIREGAQRACILIAGPISGYLASIAFGWTAGICCLVIFLLVPATWRLMREERVTVVSSDVLANAGRRLKTILGARFVWAAAGMTLLVCIAPGVGTALFYRQQNELHMTTQGQGMLSLLGGGAGMIGAFCYALAARRFNLGVLLSVSLAFASIFILGYLFYHSIAVAAVMAGVGGFGGALVDSALFHLAIRGTPPGVEGLGFALMISFRNVAVFGSDWVGSTLLDTHHASFDQLVWIDALTTLIAVPVVFLLPKVLVGRRDAS